MIGAISVLTMPRNISFVGKAEYVDSWKTRYVSRRSAWSHRPLGRREVGVRARHRRRRAAASKLVPDVIVQMLTASGVPAGARARVDGYVATGCTCPILYPLGDVP